MDEIAQSHRDKLQYLKDCVEQSYMYFYDNIKRYKEFMRFTFATSLTPDDTAKLNALQKPSIEFNVLEAFVSRLRGEFSQHEPDLSVRAADGVSTQHLDEKFIQTMRVIEGHLREIFFDAANDSFEYNIYSDILSGGYSVAKVYTDYINELSFEQKICVERVFDPTMTGFDPLARESHKGDGEYCFEMVPLTREEFKERFGERAKKLVDEMKFSRDSSNVGSFNWSYINQDKYILMVCYFYCKKKRKKKIVKLSSGHTILKEDYEDFLSRFVQEGRIEQPPIIISERMSTIETIERYCFCENEVIEHVETDYKFLPLVFIDGNSVVIDNTTGGAMQQMTRPFVYHAKGIQKLINFNGQTLANELETMVQHKFVAAIESIPVAYREAYANPQKAQVLAFNAFYKENPNLPLPPPREIQRTPTPPIVEALFMGGNNMVQAILGSYDAQLGLSNGDTSGKAIQAGAMHSNAAALPYLVGYAKGLNRIAQIIVDLIPKYYVTPRSMPIRKENGMRDYQIVNDPNSPQSISINYDPNSLQVKVEVGVNSTLQKQIALEQIIRMMSASEMFSEFINSEGLPTLLDNMDIRGIEELKVKAENYMQKLQQAQQAAAQQPDPATMLVQAQMQIEGEKTQQRREQAEGDLAVKSAQVAVDKQKADTEQARLLAEIDDKNLRAALDMEKMDAENAQKLIGLAVEIAQQRFENAGVGIKRDDGE